MGKVHMTDVRKYLPELVAVCRFDIVHDVNVNVVQYDTGL